MEKRIVDRLILILRTIFFLCWHDIKLYRDEIKAQKITTIIITIKFFCVICIQKSVIRYLETGREEKKSN